MKKGQVYNLDSFENLNKSRKALAKRLGFGDAYTGTVLERTLTHIDPTQYFKALPELTFVTSGIDADNSGGYAEKIASLRITPQGGFKQAGDKSGNKGKISLSGEDNYISVIEREAESEWSDTQLKQYAMEGRDLIGDFLRANNEIYLREIDEIGSLGKNGVGGLYNYTGFTSAAAVGPATAQTSLVCYDEVATLITEQWAGVNNTPEYMADTVDIPLAAYNHIAATPYSTTGDSKTVLQTLITNFPGVKFRASFRCDNAGGVGVTHMVAYSSKRQSMVFRLPVPLMVGEILKSGSFNSRMDAKYRVAGLDILENASGRIITGF